MNICNYCQTEFIPKGVSKKNEYKQRFCSRLCSNTAVPRRSKVAITYETPADRAQKKVKLCSHCSLPVTTRYGRFCTKCKSEGRHHYKVKNNGKLPSELTIEEYVITARGGANKFDRIRSAARKRYMSSSRPKKCFKCGYTHHYEVCHIKPIHTFSPQTVIAVVNDDSNIVALCPNCHWEIDHGIATL